LAPGGEVAGLRKKRKAALIQPVVAAEGAAGGGGADAGGPDLAGGPDGGDPVSRARRANVKVLSRWTVRFKRGASGALGVVVEGFLVEAASGIARASDASLQWKTSFIVERCRPRSDATVALPRQPPILRSLRRRR
jgi:hypothetical protein